jgi:hypothetical protein
MQDAITAMLTEALAKALKDALVPIVREAVTEALATMPPKALEDENTSNTPLADRLDQLESKLDDLESSLSDKVDSSDISDAVQDCIDSGSFNIEFRG